jgi:hypothetical protein
MNRRPRTAKDLASSLGAQGAAELIKKRKEEIKPTQKPPTGSRGNPIQEDNPTMQRAPETSLAQLITGTPIKVKMEPRGRYSLTPTPEGNITATRWTPVFDPPSDLRSYGKHSLTEPARRRIESYTVIPDVSPRSLVFEEAQQTAATNPDAADVLRRIARANIRAAQIKSQLGTNPPVSETTRIRNAFVDATVQTDDSAVYMDELLSYASDLFSSGTSTPVTRAAIVGGPAPVAPGVIPAPPPLPVGSHFATPPTVVGPVPVNSDVVIDQSYVSKGRNLPGLIEIPRLNGSANKSYLGSDIRGMSIMGHNDIFSKNATDRKRPRVPTDDLWWLKNPLKMDDMDAQLARAAVQADEPNEEHAKRQRVYAEKELSRFPRYRLYASADHVAEQILSHRSY